MSVVQRIGSLISGLSFGRGSYRRLAGKEIAINHRGALLGAPAIEMRLHRREERDDRDEPARPRPRRVDEPAPSSAGDAPPERGLSRGTLWWILVAALLLLVAKIGKHFDEYLRRTLESKV